MKLTCLFLGALLEALVSGELGDLAGHGLDVVDDELVEIGVDLLADTQLLSDRVLAGLVHFQHINMLERVFSDLPGNSKMVETLGRGTDDSLARFFAAEVLFGLSRVEREEQRMVDDTVGTAGSDFFLSFRRLLVCSFLLLVPVAWYAISPNQWLTNQILAQR